MDSRLIFATERYGYMQAAMCREKGFIPGVLERTRFPDGERYLRIESDVKGKDVIVVGATNDDAATLELFDLATGLTACGAARLSMVIPYFGYSTQERAVRKGEVVTAKARAVLLSSVPRAYLSNEVVLLDLHTAGISHYFEGHLHSVHLSAHSFVLDVVRKMAKSFQGETVVACTDAGRAKWVQQLANDAGLTAAFAYKARRAGNVTTTGINADVRDKQVIIYDDMIRTGGSLLQAAAAYKQEGAKTLTAITTHAVLPGESLAKIKASGLFSCLYATDSLPQAIELAAKDPSFVKVLPVASVFTSFFKEA